jgi:hypothetical protein
MLHTGGIDGVAQAYIVGLGHVTRGVKVSTSNNDTDMESIKHLQRRHKNQLNVEWQREDCSEFFQENGVSSRLFLLFICYQYASHIRKK